MMKVMREQKARHRCVSYLYIYSLALLNRQLLTICLCELFSHRSTLVVGVCVLDGGVQLPLHTVGGLGDHDATVIEGGGGGGVWPRTARPPCCFGEENATHPPAHTRFKRKNDDE
jgi:hypothetical protein